MIKQAIILAAGMGSRLAALHDKAPKSFITIEETPIIIRSIELLLSVGIDHILIGVGHKKEFFESLKNKYPITCIENPAYASTGSLATLAVCQNSLRKNEPVLLLESDLLYEKQALMNTIDSPYETCVLSCPVTTFGDEVYIQRTYKNTLINMSKKQEDLEETSSVLVGINKISANHFEKLCNISKQLTPEKHYEDGLVTLAQSEPVHVIKRDITWCEIDTPEHYHFASSIIWPEIKKKETVPNIPRNILLNPGPATTTDTVKYAQVVPDICPREAEFGDILTSIRNDLTNLCAHTETHTTVLIGGSGTAAVDAMLSSVISRTALVISNGAYGKRMEEILKTYNIPYIVIHSEPTEPLNIKIIEAEIIKHHADLSHICMVHHETTTGLLNPIEKIGELCQTYKLSLCIDAVSSFGAIPIDMAAMNVDFLASTANKNIQGMAGLAFVIANKKALQVTKELPAKNYYLHLWSHYDSLEKTKQTRFTPPVQTIYALRQALIELKQEGVENRYRRYISCWETLMTGLNSLNLKTLVEKEHHGKLITTILEPTLPNYNFQDMHGYLYDRGFTIYPGKLGNNHTFRISNIGELHSKDIALFIDALKNYLSIIQ